MKAVVREVVSSEGEILLFIDEIHTLVGAGKSDGAMDAANILKPALARGELRTIGATTLDEFQKYFEQDKALERRFQKVMVDEPSVEDAISILRGLKDRYENHHQVRIKDEAIISAVELSNRYITSRFLPDKAIDLIDEAAARLRLEMNSVPEEIDTMDRKVRQLEIEREAIRRENDEKRIEELTHEIDDLNAQRNAMRAKWQNERDLLHKIQDEKAQIERLRNIFNSIGKRDVPFEAVNVTLHSGFIDHVSRNCCYTDHQLFDRYHRYQIRGEIDRSESLTIQELNELKVGDYVVHIDHGVGRFGGLTRTTSTLCTVSANTRTRIASRPRSTSWDRGHGSA